MAQMRPSLTPRSAFTTPSTVDDRHIGDDKVGSPACVRHLVVHAHAFAHALTAAKDDLVAVATAQIALDFDE
jgi:hypothetical protein